MRYKVSCHARSKPSAVGTRVAVLFLRARLQPAVCGISGRCSDALPPCLRPLNPLYLLSAYGDLGILDELRATRKPR